MSATKTEVTGMTTSAVAAVAGIVLIFAGMASCVNRDGRQKEETVHVCIEAGNQWIDGNCIYQPVSQNQDELSSAITLSNNYAPPAGIRVYCYQGDKIFVIKTGTEGVDMEVQDDEASCMKEIAPR